jgi:hypothetical protein
LSSAATATPSRSAAIIFIPLLFVGVEWLRFFLSDRINPLVWTVIALPASVWMGIKAWRRVEVIRRVRLGRDGERAVAERLEALRAEGWEVLHDIVGGDFNIDHVVIGPMGVFCCETKTYRKAGGPDEHAVFDGERLQVRGCSTSGPVTQVRANAKWLSALLEKTMRRRVPVTPVLVIPGWYIKQPERGRSDVLVINDNPKMMKAFLQNGGVVLSAEDRGVIAMVLETFVRTKCSEGSNQ